MGCRMPAQKRHQRRQPCRHPAPRAPRRLWRCPSARRCLHRRGGGAQTTRLVHMMGVDISGKGVRELLGWRAAPKGPRGARAKPPSLRRRSGFGSRQGGDTLETSGRKVFFTLVNARTYTKCVGMGGHCDAPAYTCCAPPRLRLHVRGQRLGMTRAQRSNVQEIVLLLTIHRTASPRSRPISHS